MENSTPDTHVWQGQWKRDWAVLKERGKAVKVQPGKQNEVFTNHQKYRMGKTTDKVSFPLIKKV